MLLIMRDETPEEPRPLRSGYTTGSCATATSLAAARLLLTGEALDAAQIALPKERSATLRLEFCRLTAGGAEAGTLKDAGDDPDVTHGALVFARVALSAEPGVRFSLEKASAPSPSRGWCWRRASRRSTRCRGR